MRNVMRNHDETAHVWASQKQESGRAPDGRMFFEGPDLFSYGSHFVIGRIMSTQNGNGPAVVLLNADGYSVSTSKHKHIASGATRHYRQYYVPGLNDLCADLNMLGKARQIFDETLPPYQGPGASGRPGNWRDETPAETLKRNRAAIETYILKHATLSADAGAYLLGLVRLPASRFAELVARREREAAAKATREAKAAHAAALKDARRFLQEYPAARAVRLLRALDSHTYATSGKWDWKTRAYGPRKVSHSGPLAHVADSLRLAHLAAKKECWNKERVARLWALLKTARAILATRAAAIDVAEKNRTRKNLIATMRQAAAGPKPGQTWGTSTFDRIRTVAAELAETLPHSSPMGAARKGKLEAIAADMTERARVAREAENAARIAAETEKREAWLAGRVEGSGFRSTDAQGQAYIRARDVERDETGAIIGGELETSQGAFVPLAHAVRAFRFLKLCHDKGEGWKANGRTLPVGHYRIDEVAADGSFRAGCHKIGWGEVSRLATELGIFDVRGEESALVETGH